MHSHLMISCKPVSFFLAACLFIAHVLYPLDGRTSADGGGDGGGGTPYSGSSSGPAYGSSGAGGGFSDGSLSLGNSGIPGTLGSVIGGVMDGRSFSYQQNIWLNKNFFFNNGFQPEDLTYKNDDLQTTSDVYGAQTKNPIPHKTTPLFSSLHLNEWYLISLQNPSSAEYPDPEKKLTDIRSQAGSYSPYIGPLYRGTYNLFRYNSRLNQPPQGDDLATSCKRMVSSSTGGRDPYNPEWQRLEMDNCTNQYILQQNSRYSNMAFEERNSPTPSLNSSSCQPFRMVPIQDNEQEYAADWYYVIAWQKLLANSNYLARGGQAPKEPNYGAGAGPNPHNINITDPIPAPTGNFGRTELKDLAARHLQHERIMDPSHPFSPRWDFEHNERQRYSPITAAYKANPVNSVRCAGSDSNSIPVDIMKWREPRFDRHIMSRIAFNIFCYYAKFGKIRCWNLFKCTSSEPCCATKYDGKDKVPTPWCNGGTPDPSMTMGRLCQFLAKPVVPVNALKMRDGDDSDIFPYGVPEGYRFDSYFDNHRPYMRCWDTGQECGLPDGTSFRDAMNKDDGSRWSIMGAGREGQSCLIGGSLGRMGIPTPSPITDWMELKLYQTNAIRQGVFCLPRNEILNKYGDTEELVLERAGAAVQIRVPNPADGERNRYKTIPWPKSWRGYVLAVDPDERFPNLGKPGISMPTGLSDAEPGDVLVFDESVVMSGSQRGTGTGDKNVWRLPFVAYVMEADNAKRRAGGSGGGVSAGPEFVKAVAHNHGKFPDACGNTLDMYMGESFNMYKDNLPDWVKERLKKVAPSSNANDTCVDPSLNDCIEPKWSEVKRYNIHNDVR